jgi:hypothetical protein
MQPPMNADERRSRIETKNQKNGASNRLGQGVFIALIEKKLPVSL